jgi:methyl-accepting chemotaxis protein
LACGAQRYENGMPLVKTSKIASARGKRLALAEPAASPGVTNPKARKPQSSAAPARDKVAERLAAATEELASGLVQAAAAAEELRRSMEQIASGAEETAGGAQEQLAAIKSVVGHLGSARIQADTARRSTEAAQVVLVETTGQITASVRAIERNAARQAASVQIIGELERRAQDIGEITQTVSRISDQTNLLALNAAIEAARAGDHGRGFAVVADEVRALAETSEKSAQEVQALAASIQVDVQAVAATIRLASETAATEARSGLNVVATLDTVRADMGRLAKGSDDILTSALEAERAAIEAQRGAEQVASAAEEQAAAAVEAQSAVREQAQSLEQGQLAAHGLAALVADLENVRTEVSATEQIASTSEELSATIQELSSAATQIMAAVEQINRGTQQQASATQETSAALTQIEDSANVAQRNATAAGEQIGIMEGSLASSRTAVEQLMTGVGAAVESARGNLETIGQLEGIGRRIDKIVGAIALVAMQTTMLAVSGSVEAARAGSAGRGFALVSADIRALAREASVSVDTIQDTVRGILDQIASLRRDSEQMIQNTEAEIHANRTVVSALEKLDGDVMAMRTANTTILHGAAAIISATVQSAAAARQIAAAAEEASAAARQAATASTQQARGAEDLAAAIEEIASLAEELKRQDA